MNHRVNSDTLNSLLSDMSIPPVCRVRQHFCGEHIADPAAHTARGLRAAGLEGRIRPGMSVAITAGSRGIDNMALVIREVAAYLKEKGAKPFIFPAMGSHGGATAEGQLAILERYGITEESCGCPVRSCMDTVLIGKTPQGVEVFIDKLAAQADGIVAINRIKAHTAFRGPYESGLVKMLTIGMGKQKGADSLHQAGYKYFAARIPEFGRVVLSNANVLFGVALLENAFDKSKIIEVIPSEKIMEREPVLLQQAFESMPKILLPQADVLVVHELGKNHSGGGMDPNVTGRWPSPYGSGGLECQRITVLRLSELSHGNFVGLGLADVTTREVFEALDFAETYPNSITNTVMHTCKIPMVVDTDRQAILVAIKGCLDMDRAKTRMILIKNTLDMAEIFVSENLVNQVKETPGMEVVGKSEQLPFDDAGRLGTIW